ncbi:hypothetical protein [Chromobacterium haemolyticum]|uniref:hypothetical protein n=1 Tax=Chromobacterium haemolyticum TaxID=394935 RepID=UPI0009D95633|nr:hypothetical protein [Chromobacterium haemolyticum]OQS41518.1 hypothetical protein B0T39_08760 [Chromobacterium haemolyticum]
MNRNIVVILIVAIVVALAAGGGAWWWLSSHAPQAAEAPKPAAALDARFVSMDKVIVMLRGGESATRFMAVDLVFRSNEKQEAEVKAQLPFLKSIAVRALSELPADKALAMSIDDYQRLLAKAYAGGFLRERRDAPFSEVMVSKLIIE